MTIIKPNALDLAHSRASADVAVFERVASIYASRGQTSEAVFWSEAGKTASALAELARRYLERAQTGAVPPC